MPQFFIHLTSGIPKTLRDTKFVKWQKCCANYEKLKKGFSKTIVGHYIQAENGKEIGILFIYH